MLVRTSKDKENPYVMLNKTFINDPNLSLKSIGLMTYCMAKPDGWQFYVDQLASVLKDKHCSIYSGFKELIKNGYCIRTKIRDEKGKILSHDYVLFEVPQNQQPDSEESPHRGFQQVDNQQVDNQALVIKEPKVINDSSNTHTSLDLKKSSKKKPAVEKIKRKENIETSLEEHEQLLSKYGLILTESAYVYLDDWKESKKVADPKQVNLHTDYYRIKNWVMKAIKEDKVKYKKNPENNRDEILEKFKHGAIYNGAECIIRDEDISFQRGMTISTVRFKENGFKDQFDNILRKFNISLVK